MTEAMGKPGERSRRVVGTLEYLLRIRQDMSKPGRVFIYFGDIVIHRFMGFVDGYRACMHDNELPDEGFASFWLWLTEAKQHPVEPDGTIHLLRDSQGSHEERIRKYLDLVAEFAVSRPGVAEENLRLANPTYSGTFDALLRIRQDLEQGLWNALLESRDAERFAAAIDGYNACRMAHGITDERYRHFFDWLRDDKHELPGEGWPAKYLRDGQGNHEQAIRKYLNRVAEFAALQEQG